METHDQADQLNWCDLLEDMMSFVEARSKDESLAGILHDGLGWFLKLPMCRSASLFVLDTKSFEFYHSLSLPTDTKNEATNAFDELVSDGIIADALNADNPIFPYIEKTKQNIEHIQLIRLGLPSGVMGIILLFSDTNIEKMSQIPLRLLMLHSSLFASLLNNAKLIRRLEVQRNMLEQDVAERTHDIKRAQHELKTILHALKTGLIIIDPDTTKVEEINKFATSVIGKSEMEMIGTSWYNLFIPANDTEKALFTPEQIITNAEYYLRIGNGNQVPVLLTQTPVQLWGKQLVLCSFVDVTELSKAREQLNKAKSETDNANALLEKEVERANKLAIQSEKANLTKNEFLNNISTELKSPINGISGITQQLLSDATSDPEREKLSLIQSATNQLSHFVDNILALTRLKTGGVDLEEIPFDIALLMKEIEQHLSALCTKKQLVSQVTMDERFTGKLIGDRLLLRQLISHIVDNAVKFTDQGNITLRTEIVEDQTDSLLVQFTIKDSGSGIPEDKLKTLFTALGKAEFSPSEHQTGLGVGLSITKHLVDLMKGTLRAESNDQGSTFYVQIPFRKASE